MTIPPRVARQPSAAVFLVRAWRDDGQFRARITISTDITAEPSTQIEVLIADPDDVGRHLATWLNEI